MGGIQGGIFVEASFLAKVPYATVLLKCRNWGLALSRAVDIANESCAEAYQRSLQREFVDAAHFRAWVTRTAIHVAVDLLRQQARAVSLTWIDELASRPAPPACYEASNRTIGK